MGISRKIYLPHEISDKSLDRAPEDGFRRTDRGLAARASARVGGIAAGRAAPAGGRLFRPGAGAAVVGRAPVGRAALAFLPVGRADVPGMA